MSSTRESQTRRRRIVFRALAVFAGTVAALEMHPLDIEDRRQELKDAQGIGFCNITKCCTKVCPEGITITDNAIIPLKERVVDEFYDPIKKLFRIFRGSARRDAS